jgi:hypothetical protein
MNTLTFKPYAQKLRFDDDTMWVGLTDGRCLGVPYQYFPKLAAASAEERSKYIISGGGIGLHWEDLDEDISVEGLLLGIGDRTKQNIL